MREQREKDANLLMQTMWRDDQSNVPITKLAASMRAGDATPIDTERLDWLERNAQNGFELLPEGQHGADSKWLLSIETTKPRDRHGAFWIEFGGDTMRAAIDAAIAQQEQEGTNANPT